MANDQEDMLVPLDQYLKSGLHIGTKYRTKHMAPFIYKIRNDGLSVFNVQEIDNRLRLAKNLINQYKAEDIIIVCRRENGWKAVEMFAKATGIRAYNGRYPPGILTNPELEDFIEAKLVVAVDPWQDKNAINDVVRIGGIPIIGLCDTNNDSLNVDLVVPCNNKGKKSLGLIFWIFANEYLKEQGKKITNKVEDYIDE
jgi:small subunit ribosomal protein S2